MQGTHSHNNAEEDPEEEDISPLVNSREVCHNVRTRGGQRVVLHIQTAPIIRHQQSSKRRTADTSIHLQAHKAPRRQRHLKTSLSFFR